MADYNKVGLLAIRDGRLLLCRKNHSTSRLILPGGCLEPGELPLECLARELYEELGEIAVANITYVGVYSDRAAADDPKVIKTVEIELYQGELVGTPVASSEIVELVWFGENDERSQLAPSIVNKILPDLIARKILPWEEENNQ